MTLAVVATISWGSYSALNRPTGDSNVEEPDQFELFDPLLDNFDSASIPAGAAGSGNPRELNEPATDGTLPALSPPGINTAGTAPDFPASTTSHRSNTIQASFSDGGQTRPDSAVWLSGTIEADELSIEPTQQPRASFILPDGPTLP